jgi:hypothetical protein
MKNRTKSNWHRQLIFIAMTTVFMLAASSLIFAQSKKYKPGDRVECDDSQMDRWQKGTVVPYLQNDFDKESGRWYRVKFDSDTIPGLTRSCMATHTRPLVENKDSQNDSNTDEPDQSNKNNETNNKPSAKNKAAKYKLGDRVECDDAQMDIWKKGTVVPYVKYDLDTESGRWYRVKFDSDTIPNLTRSCLVTHMRPLFEKDNSQDDSESNAQNQSNKNNATNDKSSSKNKATKYKPGDRVECDKAQMGIWEKGTVIHYRPGDIDKESGRYYRVKLDGYDLYFDGHACSTNFIRPINEAPLKSTGKYKVGDRVEAKSWGSTWLPAKIIAIEGAFYKVSFENRDNTHDESVEEERIRPLGTRQREENRQNETLDTNPKTGGAPRSLPGTAWKIDFGKGVTGTVFLFCRNGRWHNVLPNSIGAIGKSYTVSGNTLTTVNQDDGMVQKWKMSWQGDVLVLNDGKQTLKLHYNGETQCK